MASKRYYDIFSYLATQLAFSFTVAPFILLSFRDSYTAWKRVYFYCIIGVVVGLAAFSGGSPVRGWAKRRVARRNASAAGKRGDDGVLDEAGKGLSTHASNNPSNTSNATTPATGSQSDGNRPSLLDHTTSHLPDTSHGAYGVSDDPGRDLDELMEQVKEEVRIRRERGMSVGASLQEAVARRFGGGGGEEGKGKGEAVQ